MHGKPSQEPPSTRSILRLLVSTLPTVSWTLRLAYRESPRLVAEITGLTLVRGVLPAAFALSIKQLLDTGLQTANTGSNGVGFAPWLALAAALAVGEAVLEVASTRLNGRLQLDLSVATRSRFVDKASRLDISYFDRPEGQDDLARARRSSEAVGRVLQDLATSATSAVQGASLAAVMIVIEPYTIVLLVVALPGYLLFEFRLASLRYRVRSAWVTMDRWSKYYLARLTRMPAVAEIQLLGLGAVLTSRFRKILERFRTEEREFLSSQFRGSAIFLGGTSAGAFALLARVCLRVASGTATLGDVGVYALSIGRLRGVLYQGAQTTARLLENLLMVGDLRDFLCYPARSGTSGKGLARGDGHLRVERLTFAYPGTDRPVLRDLSLEIQPGETVALVGENGSGKSTLVYLLAGLYRPATGSITLDGHDIPEIDPASLHRQISFVFQRFNRYEASAADNIAFGNWPELAEDRKRTEEVARSSGAHEIVASMPDGYDTMLGRLFGTHELSGGQWQRLAIARAFARDSAVLILDEPTIGLDPRSEYDFFRRARVAARGRTTVLISHRLSTVTMADRIMVLGEGRICEQGRHAELLRQGGRYAELHELYRARFSLGGQ